MKCYVVYYSYKDEHGSTIDVVYINKEEAEQYVKTMNEQQDLLEKKETEIYHKLGEIEDKFDEMYPDDEEKAWDEANNDKEYLELSKLYDECLWTKSYFMKEVDLIG